MGKDKTFVFGLDSPDDYGPEYVLSALGAASPEPGPGTSVLRVLFLPSFHPECLLSFTDEGSRGSIELVSAQASLWYYGCHVAQKAAGRLDPEDPVPDQPTKWSERADLLPPDLDPLRREIQSLVRTNPKDTPVAGRDGITVRLESWEADRKPVVASAWSPAADRFPEIHQMLAAIHGLASARLQDEKSLRLLENLFGYLDLGLSARDLGGDPRVVRLFGHFSTDDRTDLEAFLSALPPDQALLMDLSNFEGMGTALYPLFVRFAKRPGKTLWWASASERRHLRDMRIPEDRIDATRDEALKKLSTGP